MEIYKNIVSIVSIVFKPFRKQELIYSSRYARNIDVHTPRSAWAPMERKNVQLMAINV